MHMYLLMIVVFILEARFVQRIMGQAQLSDPQQNGP